MRHNKFFSALTVLSLLLVVSSVFAVPTSSVIDDFNRADADPTTNGTWTSKIRPADSGGLNLSGNQIVGVIVSSRASYWSAATFGPDSEVCITIITLDPANSFNLWLRITNPDSTSLNAYGAFVGSGAGADQYRYFRIDNDSFTFFGGADITGPALSSGDRACLIMIGSTMVIWTKIGSADPTPLDSGVTDTTHTTAGNIGVRMNGAVLSFDDFRGGTISAQSPRAMELYRHRRIQ